MPTLTSFSGPDLGIADRIIVPLDLGDGRSRIDPGSGIRVSYGIGGLPFLSAASVTKPMELGLAPILKQQLDNSQIPGDGAFLNFWVRAQTDWSAGAGTVTQEPQTDDRVSRSFASSYGCDVFSTGKLKLSTVLNRRKNGWDVPTLSGGNAGVYGSSTFAMASNGDEALIARGNKVYLLTQTVPTQTGETLTDVSATGFFTTPSAGASALPSPLYEVVTSLVYGGGAFYLSTNMAVYRYRNSVANRIFTFPNDYGVGQLNVGFNVPNDKGSRVWYVKDRLIMTYGQSVWAMGVPDASSNTNLVNAAGLNGPLFTKLLRSNLFKWRGVGASGTAIYMAGRVEANGAVVNGSDVDGVYKIDLTTSAYPPTLSSPSSAAQLPKGEYVNYMCTFLSAYMVLGTNKGIRIALISPSNGVLSYGPILPSAPIPGGDFLVRAGSVDYPVYDVGNGAIGTIRIDMGQVNFEDITAPWSVCQVTEAGYDQSGTTAYNLAIMDAAPSDATASATVLASAYGETLRVWMDIPVRESNQAYITATDTFSNGFLVTPKIEIGTAEEKFFHKIFLRLEDPLTNNARIDVQMLDDSGIKFVGSITASARRKVSLELNPLATSSVASFAFNIYPDTVAVPNVSPVVLSWQIRALPAVPRQKLFGLQLLCFDHERDSTGVQYGYDGYALQRYQQLEEVAKSGIPFILQDVSANQEYQVVCDALSFAQTAPPVQASGFGGIVQITLKTLG